MARSLKRRLLIVGGIATLVLLLGLGLLLSVDVNRLKPGMERAATDVLGMSVHFDGPLAMRLFPGPHLTIGGSRVLDERGAVVAAARRVDLWIAVLPILRGEVRVHRIGLEGPRISIERNRAGTFNVAKMMRATVLLRALDGASLSFSDGALSYVDLGSGRSIQATGCRADLKRIRVANATGPAILQRVSFDAKVACEQAHGKDFDIATLEASLDARNGILECDPMTMQVFGGRAAVKLRADVTGPVPEYRVHGSLQHFRIEAFLRTLSPVATARGEMQLTTDLSMQGTNSRTMRQSATGSLSLRGAHLVLEGSDLDRTFARFESTQNFSLVDGGALFLAGPMGLAVTKGYNFATIFQGTGGHSDIGTFVSDWRVERGVAQAQDVAMTTSHHRVALQGGLDFVNERFSGVTFAVVDAHGCAIVRQAVHGPFIAPVIEKPRALASLTGPVRKLFRTMRDVLPSAPCVPFYSGTVRPPS